MSTITFPYSPNIPNAPDNPSFDQPIMQQNSQSINSIWAVDHVTFNGLAGSDAPGASAGQHLKVTFNGKNVPGGAPIDPVSIMYSNNVTPTAFNTVSASSVSEVFYQNANAIFPVSMIKAFGCFDATGTSLNTWNLNCTRVGRGTFNFAMPANCCTGNSYLVISTAQAAFSPPNPSSASSVGVAYSIASNIAFTINYSNSGVNSFDPNQFSVLVLQL